MTDIQQQAKALRQQGNTYKQIVSSLTEVFLLTGKFKGFICE
jgi:hypothetical protein